LEIVQSVKPVKRKQPRFREKLLPATEFETEVGMKVASIMQVVSEDLDDSGKRVWRKMLGILEEAHYPRDQEPKNQRD
jgi:hypothetical protein